MKKMYIIFGIFLLCSFTQNIKGQNESTIEGRNYINGFIDHALGTLPVKQYEALDSFLTEHFKFCWMKQPGKAFIFCNSQRPYFEFWNAGVFYQFGYQVGFASPQADAKEKAKKYYASEGIDFDIGIFTVGKEGDGGHPVGGTFYVDYGSGGKIPLNDSMKIDKFVGLITSIPAPRSDIINDYKFFNLSVSGSDGIYTMKDTAGFTVQIMEVPVEAMVFGHVALLFRLKDAVTERQEYDLTTSMKAIIDGKDFTLILNNRLYNDLLKRQ
jgi:hypothetical protein